LDKYLRTKVSTGNRRFGKYTASKVFATKVSDWIRFDF